MNCSNRKNNKIVRDLMKKYDLKQYELAHILNINEGTLCRYLRTEMSEKMQERCVIIVENHFNRDAFIKMSREDLIDLCIRNNIYPVQEGEKNEN